MTEQPKRRGRPPGSKNRPVDESNLLKLGRLITGDPPFIMPKIEAITGPAPIKVVLSTRGQAWGDPVNEQAVDWPAEWRLPQPGDSIHLRNDWGGFVASVDFDIEKGVVRVFLR